ncbi:MAG: Flp family type IVb pilin [Devosiaceae bacterium]|nr:Flp family type IVb pilin [Devosiaceae bacterium]
MQKVWRSFGQFVEHEGGATAVEYGLIAGLMAVAAIAAFAQMGNGLVNLFGVTDAGVGGVVHNAASSADLT